MKKGRPLPEHPFLKQKLELLQMLNYEKYPSSFFTNFLDVGITYMFNQHNTAHS
jgi:hypothetical protein